MSEQGWITIHRGVRDHWLYEEKRTFSKYEAWIDLLMDANHKDKKILFDGNLVEVQRGQVITSLRKICNRWGWSNNKAKRFLNLLQEDEMIIWKSTTKKTVVTIVNYDFYQGGKIEKAPPGFNSRTDDESNVTEKSTGNAHSNTPLVQSDTPISEKPKAPQKHTKSISEAHQKHTNNNVNNDNNVNKIDDDDSKSENVISVYEKVFGMANPIIIENIDYWCKDLSSELVIAALKKSAENDAFNFKYTERILRDWEKNNVKTLEDVSALDKKFEKKNTKKQTSAKPILENNSEVSY
ncbi:DnaD domain-containing protein [Vagococcus hydrophili]|uniref:DnaD domain protein n=1 Tax=Vagococcus hydrophili TaxID=2714947 RepID=A0A6G8AQ12_9ENTE|nr:DnaD domain protein [Vagococcus hydrophili]QIL47059.1 DnaD domain protein [Vagococcus hydrophili]